MHDIGKYLIAKEILFKPDLLDEEERAIMLCFIITNDGTERATRRAWPVMQFPSHRELLQSLTFTHRYVRSARTNRLTPAGGPEPS